MHLPAGFPIVLSLISFILAILAVVAGRQPGFMEEYYVIMFNTSALGRNLVPTPTAGVSASQTSGSGLGGFFGSLVSSATAAVGALESGLADIEASAADQLARKLGIKEFYTLHITDLCEGDFSPNATAPNAGYNVTNCTRPLQTTYTNVSALLDHELKVGPLDLNLADIGVVQDLQDELDKVPSLFKSLAGLYIVNIACTAMALLGSVTGFFFHTMLSVTVNLAMAVLALLMLLSGNLITTAGGNKVTEKVTKYGTSAGITASQGTKFLAITWAAFSLMIICTAYWVFQFMLLTKSYKWRGAKRSAPSELDLSRTYFSNPIPLPTVPIRVYQRLDRE
ncbi:hypothetical protein NKR23_g12442 [Pleurostoma richardsiae]|uniref:SUR7 protein n=1 Tax=Pleurostoma richardsiae TaxID=41990 RepID=A0AA38VCS7_9PEZI|nr:hypothetical protein NKR23_g12442 [Pleurostoma richardsiae]